MESSTVALKVKGIENALTEPGSGREEYTDSRCGYLDDEDKILWKTADVMVGG